MSGKEMFRVAVKPPGGGLTELPASVKEGVAIPWVPGINIVGPPEGTAEPGEADALKLLEDHTNCDEPAGCGFEKVLLAAKPPVQPEELAEQ